MTKNHHKNKESKILIISGYAPPATHGSGLMMYNLLSQFPKGSLAVLTETYSKDAELSKYKLDANYYTYGSALSSFEIKKDTSRFSISGLKRAVKGLPGFRLLGELFFLTYLIRRIVSVGLHAIKKEKPSMMVGYSDVGPNLISTYILHKLTKTPYSIFFYDMYVGNKLPKMFAYAAGIFEKSILKNASHVFVMCDPLKEHYTKKYNLKNITIIYNSILPTPVTHAPYSITQQPEKPFTVAYLGNIYWAQEQTLRNLHQALGEITAFKTKLLVYTHNPIEQLHALGIHENENTIFTKCLPEEVPGVLDQSDVAYIGLSFNTQYPNLINTSSPGRLCDFIRSNTPILVHAPRESFIAQYAKRFDFAYVVDENSITQLRQALTEMHDNRAANVHKITQAHLINNTNHNAKKNAELYFNTLTNHNSVA